MVKQFWVSMVMVMEMFTSGFPFRNFFKCYCNKKILNITLMYYRLHVQADTLKFCKKNAILDTYSKTSVIKKT